MSKMLNGKYQCDHDLITDEITLREASQAI